MIQIDGENQQDDQALPTSYFLRKWGAALKLHQAPGQCILLLVTQSKINLLIHIAHSHSLGSHLGARNTLKKLRDHFHWPGMKAEIRDFCQQFPQCQCSFPKNPAPALLLPLPVIGMPFERVGMDLLWLFPKSPQGHEFILVIVGYANWYSEAVTLQKATSHKIARELFFLFSQVGIPKDCLTDQGMPFFPS